jgi:hypothetical protein
MATLSAGSSVAVVLDNDDVLAVSGNGRYSVAPTTGSKSEGTLTGTQNIGPFQQYVTVTLTAVTDLTYTTSSNTGVAPIAKYSTDSSGNVTGLVGPGGAVYAGFRPPFPTFVGSSTNKAVFATAIGANAAKVAYVGHSIANGNNQNYYGSTVYNMLRNTLKEAFPNITFTFEDYGISGTKAADFLGNPNTTITAPASSVYREYWQNDSGAITTAASWANKVAAFLPDLMFMQWDLNETDHVAFGAAVQANIDDVTGNARWVSKRPSLVLVASHSPGADNGAVTKAIVRKCHKVLRALARKNNIPLIDAGRVYDVMTTGTDPVNLIPVVSGESGWMGALPVGAALSTSLYESKIGVAYSPVGTTVRDQSTGASLRTYRTRLAADGANQNDINVNLVGGIASLFYRADPNDANYATGTGAQYELRITTTAVQVYYWPAGSAVAISGASATLTNGTGTNTRFQMRVEYKGANHKVTIVAPTGEIKTFEFVDYQRLDAGYNGFGYSGTGGAFFNSGTLGNVSSGMVLEYWDTALLNQITQTDAQLFGSVSDWTTNPASLGGNAINHLTNIGYKVVYEYAMYDVMRQLQAK